MENRKNLKKSVKYVNNNALISTNEFMQLFFLNFNDYLTPRFLRDRVLFEAKKNIDNKYSINLSWNLFSFIRDTNWQQVIVNNGIKSLNASAINNIVKNYAVFSREEIIMYLILFNHYVENAEHLDENGNIVISIKEIHCKYRNKSLKMYSQIDESTLKTYFKSIKLLSEKAVSINTEAYKNKIPYIRKNEIPSFFDKIINYTSIRDKTGAKLLGIKYNLGKFGDFLIASKRMTSKFPVELLERPYKQIGQVFMGIYISKMLYINTHKRKFTGTLTLSIPTILNNIIYFDKNGINTGKTLFQRLNDNTKQNYRQVKNFENSLKIVLELYKKHFYIQNYELDNISVANYKSKNTKLKIIVK